MCLKKQGKIEKLYAKEGSHIVVTAFIDKEEIEEMLGEYYDFQTVTEEQWNILDNEVRLLCEERGINAQYCDDYVRVCDICCEKIHITPLKQ